MDYSIIKASMTDYESILHLYKKCTRHLESIGIHQWDDTYPSPGMLRNNIRDGVTWVIRVQEVVIATVTLDSDQDEKFNAIYWAYPSDRVLVIHRLCVDPDHQGRGLARYMIAFSEKYAEDHGYEVIRLDAFLGNTYSQKLYRKLHYHEAIGYCYYPPDDIMCNCFEKKICL